MDNQTLYLPSQRPSAPIPMLERNITPQLSLSTSGLSALPASSLTISDRSPCLSPSSASPNHAHTLQMSKTDDAVQGHVQSMKEKLSSLESNDGPMRDDSWPVPKLFLKNYADEIPVTTIHRHRGENNERFTYGGEYGGIVDIDQESSHCAFCHITASNFPDLSFGGKPPYDSCILSLSRHRRTPTSDSGIGSSAPSIWQLGSVSSSSPINASQVPHKELRNACSYKSVSAVQKPLTPANQGLFKDSGNCTRQQASVSCVTSTVPKEDIQRTLSDEAISVMISLILEPLIKNQSFIEFHDLCHEAVQILKTGGTEICCLRDLEKYIIHKANQFCNYIEFSKAFLQNLQESIPRIPQCELQRKYDPPYSREYLTDINGQFDYMNDSASHFLDNTDSGNEMEFHSDYAEDSEQRSSSLPYPQGAKSRTSATINCQSKRRRLDSQPFTINPRRLQEFQTTLDHFPQSVETKRNLPHAARQGTYRWSPYPPSLYQQQQQMHDHALSRPDNELAAQVEGSPMNTRKISFHRYNDPHVKRTTTVTHFREEEQRSVGRSFFSQGVKDKSQQQGQPTPSKTAGAKNNNSSSVRHDREYSFLCPRPNCGQKFARNCDLTKHEKTHTRPHKCTFEGCKYEKEGFPTEKERDRHISDKHSSEGPVYECEYPPCTYKSKRQSNCKQHMEKTHGYKYVRTKMNPRINKKNVGAPNPVGQKLGKPEPNTSQPGSISMNSLLGRSEDQHNIPLDSRLVNCNMQIVPGDLPSQTVGQQHHEPGSISYLLFADDMPSMEDIQDMQCNGYALRSQNSNPTLPVMVAYSTDNEAFMSGNNNYQPLSSETFNGFPFQHGPHFY